MRAGALLGAGMRCARLTMRPLSPAMIEAYLEAAGEAGVATVGGYQLERHGAHLFTEVEGDHFTVMGLPLLDVLAALRDIGAAAR
jgi:septum formation protein